MSYTVVNPGPKPRPGVVTAASALLYVAALTQLAALGLSVMQLGPVRRVLDEEFADLPEADAVRTVATAGIIGAIVVSALLAVGTVVLGMLVAKGRNPARIVTWVLAGLGVLCYSCSLAGTAVSGIMSGSLGQTDTDTAEMQRRVEEALPGWQAAAETVVGVVTMVALLAVIILLAVPASNEYFRKEQEVWVPPTLPWDAGSYPPPPMAPPAPPAPPPPQQ